MAAQSLEKLANPLVLRRDRQRAVDVFNFTIKLRSSLKKRLGFAPSTSNR